MNTLSTQNSRRRRGSTIQEYLKNPRHKSGASLGASRSRSGPSPRQVVFTAVLPKTEGAHLGLSQEELWNPGPKAILKKGEEGHGKQFLDNVVKAAIAEVLHGQASEVYSPSQLAARWRKVNKTQPVTGTSKCRLLFAGRKRDRRPACCL